MGGRMGGDQASSLVLALVTLGFSIATYNLITLVIHSQIREVEKELVNISSSSREIDPIAQKPGGMKRSELTKRPFHVAVTAGEGTYNKWQCRIMYYWYKKVKNLEGSEMGGFTRVLHSGKPDDLMDEIPTFVVNGRDSNEI